MIAPRDSWMMPPPCNEMVPPGAPRSLAERVFSPDVLLGHAVLSCLPRARRRLSPVSSMRGQQPCRLGGSDDLRDRIRIEARSELRVPLYARDGACDLQRPARGRLDAGHRRTRIRRFAAAHARDPLQIRRVATKMRPLTPRKIRLPCPRAALRFDTSAHA